MHVGYTGGFQNPGNRTSDAEVYADELRLADLAVDLGFDSLWTVEHHFTDYFLSPDPVALEALVFRRAVPPSALARFFSHEDPRLQSAALLGLDGRPDEPARKALLAVLNSPQERGRTAPESLWVTGTLANLGSRRLVRQARHRLAPRTRRACGGAGRREVGSRKWVIGMQELSCRPGGGW